LRGPGKKKRGNFRRFPRQEHSRSGPTVGVTFKMMKRKEGRCARLMGDGGGFMVKGGIGGWGGERGGGKQGNHVKVIGTETLIRIGVFCLGCPSAGENEVGTGKNKGSQLKKNHSAKS